MSYIEDPTVFHFVVTIAPPLKTEREFIAVEAAMKSHNVISDLQARTVGDYTVPLDAESLMPPTIATMYTGEIALVGHVRDAFGLIRALAVKHNPALVNRRFLIRFRASFWIASTPWDVVRVEPVHV